MQHLTQPEYNIDKLDRDHPPIKVVAIQVNGSAQNQHRIEIRTLQILNAYEKMHGEDTIISLDGIPNVKSREGVFVEFVKYLGLDPDNLLTDDEYEADSKPIDESVVEHLSQ